MFDYLCLDLEKFHQEKIILNTKHESLFYELTIRNHEISKIKDDVENQKFLNNIVLEEKNVIVLNF